MSATARTRARPRRTRRLLLACAACVLVLCDGVPARAQLARLAAPGPVAKAHASFEDNCEKCHESGKGIAADRCLACHKPVAERIAAARGVHKGAAAGCVSCHKEHGGRDADLLHLDAANFDHAVQALYPLEGRHAAIAARCEKCHRTRSFLKATSACAGCHADIHKPTLGSNCERCHSVAFAFRDTRTRYDHSKGAFALGRGHQHVECAKCHVNKVYTGTRSACGDCHRDPHQQKFAASCASCHTAEAWKTQKIDHAQTGFALRGSHGEAKCESCHKQSPVKAKLRADRCGACHADVHRAQFKDDCGACHNERTFKDTKFDHKARTKSGFDLTGRHRAAACTACHKEARPGGAAASGRARPPKTTGNAAALASVGFRGLPTTCVSCHPDVHRAELGTACERCHTSATFRLTAFVHARKSEFFAGQHSAVECARCHAPALTPKQSVRTRTDTPLDGWKFTTVPTACASCHRDVHLGQVGTECQTCHATSGAKFAVVGFSHGRTTFPLTGRHQQAACDKCHKRETAAFPAGRGTAVRLKGVSTACRSCHEDRHFGQVGSRCDTCHTTTSFKIASYQHAGKRGFFVAKHAIAKCQDCHKLQEGVFPAGRGSAIRYTGFGTACATCHADKHVGSFGRECASCHSASAWAVVSRSFHKAGVFPLEGRHLSVECASCHSNGVIKGTPTRCYDCHWVRRQDDRYRTRLGTACEACHRPFSWLAVNWNHESKTGMRLSPVHRTLGCEACHKADDFTSPGMACISCHQQDYLRATNPNHSAAGFPTTCESCHKATDPNWRMASLNHAAYPLVGVHATQPCAACHRNSVYRGTPRDCYSCHQADYARTANPNHAAAGFPTTCEVCHRPADASWFVATFSHTWFPNQGRHAASCSTCHTDRTNYKVFTCLTCHDRSGTDRHHSGVGAYRYDSQACYACHPRG